MLTKTWITQKKKTENNTFRTIIIRICIVDTDNALRLIIAVFEKEVNTLKRIAKLVSFRRWCHLEIIAVDLQFLRVHNFATLGYIATIGTDVIRECNNSNTHIVSFLSIANWTWNYKAVIRPGGICRIRTSTLIYGGRARSVTRDTLYLA